MNEELREAQKEIAKRITARGAELMELVLMRDITEALARGYQVGDMALVEFSDGGKALVLNKEEEKHSLGFKHKIRIENKPHRWGVRVED